MADNTRAQIGTTGGLHITNYLKDSRNGGVVAPIQAGRIYGPVAFPNWQANFVSGPANYQNVLDLFRNNVAGYMAPKR